MELKGYTNIPDWMLSFDLDVYETIILAVIFGFSQDGDSSFSGSQRYLASKAKCTRRKVVSALQHLTAEGYIIKQDVDIRGIHLCEYKMGTRCIGCECGSQGGCECGSHNNIDKDIIDNTLSNNKRANGFVKPSLDEVRAYCEERNNGVDAENFFNFYEAKGWKIGKDAMRDWKAAIRTWERRTAPSVAREERKESVMERNFRMMDEMYGTDFHGTIYKKKKEVCDEQ